MTRPDESRSWPEPDNACEAEPVSLITGDRAMAMLDALARAERRLEDAILNGTAEDVAMAIEVREAALASATVLFTGRGS